MCYRNLATSTVSTGFCGTSSTGEVPRFPLHNFKPRCSEKCNNFWPRCFRISSAPTNLVGEFFFWGGEDVVGVLFHYVGKQGNMGGVNKNVWQKRSSVIVAIIFTIEMVTFFWLYNSNAQILGKRAYLRTMPMCGQLWTGMKQNGGPSSHERKVYFDKNWKADDLDKNLSIFWVLCCFFLNLAVTQVMRWQWHVIWKKPCSLQQAIRCLRETPLWRYVSHNNFLGNNRSRSSNLTIAIDWK